MNKIKPIGIDGIDFINIYSKAETPLGRFLSNWTQCELDTRVGEFESIEGLIFFLGSFESPLKLAHGYQAKKLGEQLDKGIRLPEELFKEIIVEAMECKIVLTDRKIVEAFKDSTLPFVHFYEYGGKRIVPTKWLWQIEAWEEIREKMKNNNS